VHLTVPAWGRPGHPAPGFKITEALGGGVPGADRIDVIQDATPTFVWADDSSEEGYELSVFDAYGTWSTRTRPCPG